MPAGLTASLKIAIRRGTLCDPDNMLRNALGRGFDMTPAGGGTGGKMSGYQSSLAWWVHLEWGVVHS